MKNENLFKNLWNPITPNSKEDLLEYEKRSYKDAKILFEKEPKKAKKILNEFIKELETRKIAYDVYVWQRIEAIKSGVNKAIKEHSKQSK